MRRHVLRFAVATALGAASLQAQDLPASDVDHRLMQFGVAGRAERIVHEGRPYLLVELRAGNLRQRPMDRGNGVTEYAPVRDGGPAILPLVIDCGGITMEVGGQQVPAHTLSLCRGRTSVRAGASMPLYVVFPYPEPGPVRVGIPVTVLEDSGSVRIGDARPTGTHRLALSVLIQPRAP